MLDIGQVGGMFLRPPKPSSSTYGIGHIVRLFEKFQTKAKLVSTTRCAPLATAIVDELWSSHGATSASTTTITECGVGTLLQALRQKRQWQVF